MSEIQQQAQGQPTTTPAGNRLGLPTTHEDWLELIAKQCHEANKHYTRNIGDFSQHSWEEAEKWQRDSAIRGVAFHIMNPTASASASHDSWMKEKVETGWIWGPVKDPAKKEHPSMVPYEQLPLSERIKDYLFRATVHAFLDAGIDLGK